MKIKNTMGSKYIKQKVIHIGSALILPIVKLYWFLFRPETKGVKCVIECSGEILLVRHTYGSGRWTFPGGTISGNENPQEAIKREIKEELGIKIFEPKLIGQFLDQSQYIKDNVICFMTRVENKQVFADENEILEAKWYPCEDLPDALSIVAQKIWQLWQGT